MNYSSARPFLPPPPALPRFALPSFDEGEGDEGDPLDFAATEQRPSIDPVRAGRVLQRIARPVAVEARVDATSEVQVEDILLEVYAEDPPPPTRRSAASVASPPSADTSGRVAQVSIAAAIAATVAPTYLPPSRASRPLTPHHGFSAAGFSSYRDRDRDRDDEESASVAPVAFPSVPMTVVGPSPSPSCYPQAAHHPEASTVAPRSRAGLFALGALVVVLTVAGTVGVALGARSGTLARWIDSTRRSKDVAPAVVTVTASPVAAPAVPPAVVTASVATAADVPVAPPSVSVDSLPRPSVAPNATLVTFPASAQGHRVFFDGRPIAITEEPLVLRCGRHMIRIGSTGRPRVTDLACGGQATLVR